MDKKRYIVVGILIVIVMVILSILIFPLWWNSGEKANARYGITMSVHKVNEKQIEVKMECTAKDGYEGHHLHHGYFIVEKATIFGWKELQVINGNYVSNAVYEGIEGSHDLKVNWVGKYGELPDGIYRIGMGMLDRNEEEAGFFYTTFRIEESGNSFSIYSE